MLIKSKGISSNEKSKEIQKSKARKIRVVISGTGMEDRFLSSAGAGGIVLAP